MRRFFVVVPFCVLFGGLANSQTSVELKHVTVAVANMDWPSTLTAQSIEKTGGYPAVITLKGNVEVKTPVCIRVQPGQALTCDGYTLLHADEVTFHEDTGKMEASGNVTVEPRQHEGAGK